MGKDENGIPQFDDQAANFGLDLVGLSTQAIFFDYDLDGDPDMFILNHSVHNNGVVPNPTFRETTHPPNKLLRNANGQFSDVSAETGIAKAVSTPLHTR